ncbi:hypothetical protein [Commensalibacter papalotli (ex Servin-Garciduenas et al. 2014)]|uniref:Uncharacterized protein n=1 Tax=Commensalibacter papalotli (ex Servin-Garciduenas et al. 2014) TaxID=1208583 RepID=W7DXZ4_9PROT|nr:hypothetical protein [Commensalibacter papalotli (ex Servin-Garciduenas et al. 2014)]EUK19093.1 hypothetical protein COMX_05065 [Commensalibacter papalotli (ex Servin-Garciduenas et al. 2014)]
MAKPLKPNLNYDLLIKNTERLEDLLTTYKDGEYGLKALYEILQPLFQRVYERQVEKIFDGKSSVNAILSCAGYQISDSGYDRYYPDLRNLYSDFYWEVQGLGIHSDRKPGHFHINSIETENLRSGG